MPLIFKLAKAFKKFEISLGRDDDKHFHLDDKIIESFQKGDQGGYKILKEGFGGGGSQKVTHAEMHVVNYLINILEDKESDKISDEIYIGISKLCCIDCSLVIRAINEVSVERINNVNNEDLSNKKVKIRESLDNQPVIYGRRFNIRGWHGLEFSDKWEEPAFLKDKKNKAIRDKYTKLRQEIVSQVKSKDKASMLHSDSESVVGYTSDSSESQGQIISTLNIEASLERFLSIAERGDFTEAHLKKLEEIQAIAQKAKNNRTQIERIIRILGANKPLYYAFEKLKLIYSDSKDSNDWVFKGQEFFNDQENKQIFQNTAFDDGSNLFEIFVEEKGSEIHLKEDAQTILASMLDKPSKMIAKPLSLNDNENEELAGYAAESETSRPSSNYPYQYDEKGDTEDLDEPMDSTPLSFESKTMAGLQGLTPLSNRVSPRSAYRVDSASSSGRVQVSSNSADNLGICADIINETCHILLAKNFPQPKRFIDKQTEDGLKEILESELIKQDKLIPKQSLSIQDIARKLADDLKKYLNYGDDNNVRVNFDKQSQLREIIRRSITKLLENVPSSSVSPG